MTFKDLCLVPLVIEMSMTSVYGEVTNQAVQKEVIDNRIDESDFAKQLLNVYLDASWSEVNSKCQNDFDFDRFQEGVDELVRNEATKSLQRQKRESYCTKSNYALFYPFLGLAFILSAASASVSVINNINNNNSNNNNNNNMNMNMNMNMNTNAKRRRKRKKRWLSLQQTLDLMDRGLRNLARLPAMSAATSSQQATDDGYEPARVKPEALRLRSDAQQSKFGYFPSEGEGTKNETQKGVGNETAQSDKSDSDGLMGILRLPGVLLRKVEAVDEKKGEELDYHDAVREHHDRLNEIINRMENFKFLGLPSVKEINDFSGNVTEHLRRLPRVLSDIRDSVLSSSSAAEPVVSERRTDTPDEEEVRSLEQMARILDPLNLAGGIQKMLEGGEEGERPLALLEVFNPLNITKGIQDLFRRHFAEERILKEEVEEEQNAVEEVVVDQSMFDILHIINPLDPTSSVANFTRNTIGGVRDFLDKDSFFNPGEDFTNIAIILRIIPRLVPYIIDHYFPKLEDFIVGAEFSDEELFQIHQSLIDLHYFMIQVRKDLNADHVAVVAKFGDLIEENNVGLMAMILNLMLRADGNENNTVILTNRDVQKLQQYFISPQDVMDVLEAA